MKLVNTPTLEMQRLILRKFRENDLDAVFLIFSDEEYILAMVCIKIDGGGKSFSQEKYIEVYKKEHTYKHVIYFKYV